MSPSRTIGLQIIILFMHGFTNNIDITYPVPGTILETTTSPAPFNEMVNGRMSDLSCMLRVGKDVRM